MKKEERKRERPQNVTHLLPFDHKTYPHNTTHDNHTPPSPISIKATHNSIIQSQIFDQGIRVAKNSGREREGERERERE